MPLWENSKKLQTKKIFCKGITYKFKFGRAKVSELYLWQLNPRLADECRDFKDDDEAGNIQFQLERHLFRDDAVVKLMRKIEADGGVNNPIFVYKSPDTSGLYVVFDGNCRFCSVRTLNKNEPKDSRWKSIPIILMEGVDYDTAYDIACSQNVDGQIEWKPYELATYLYYPYQRERDNGLNEDEAVKSVFEIIKNSKYKLQDVKDYILTKQFIDDHLPGEKSKFRAVLEGYITPTNRGAGKKIIDEGHYTKQELDKMVKKCIKAEVNFSSNPFRNKLKKVWPGALNENAQKREFFKSLAEGKTQLDTASEVISQKIIGEMEKKKINDFLAFLDHSPEQRKHIIRGIRNNKDMKHGIFQIRDVLKDFLINADRMDEL